MRKEVIIIGGGASGLAAGCYSMMNNYNTIIFDNNSKPGGLLTTWERSLYKFDGSVSFLYGNKPNSFFYQIFNELNISNPELYSDLNEFNYLFPNNISLKITNNLESFRKDLIKLSPKNINEINVLIEDIKLMVSSTLSSNGAPVFDKKFFSMKYLQTAEDYFNGLHDENLKFIFTKIFSSTLPLHVILWFLGRFVNNELSYTRYGSLSISENIAARFVKLGGIIQHNKEVKKIIIEKDRAVGVELTDESIHYADVIICACDYHSVFYNLLEDKYSDKLVNDRFKNWKLFDGIVLISLGVNKKFCDLPFYNNVLFDSPINVLGRDIQDIHLKNFSHLEDFAPEGKSVIQIAFFSDFKEWHDLRKDRARYYHEKQLVAKQFIEKLDKYLPGLNENVEEIDVSTPYTIWRYSKNYKGAYEGWLPTVKTITQILSIKIENLESLYLAGQWLRPGGGVGPSLLTGKKAVELMCKDDDKSFIATV